MNTEPEQLEQMQTRINELESVLTALVERINTNCDN